MLIKVETIVVNSNFIVALKWSYLGFLTRAGLQVIANIVIARMTGPETFGHYAVMVVTAGLLYVIFEGGASATLVKLSEDGGADDRNALFYWLIRSAGFLLAVGVLLLVVIDKLYGGKWGSSEAFLMLVGSSLQVLGAYPLGRLRGSLRIADVQFNQTVSLAMSLVLAVVLLRFVGIEPIWALVIFWVGNQLFNTCMGYFVVRQDFKGQPCRIRNAFIRQKTREFGRGVGRLNVINWVIEQSDSLLVGRVIGAAGAGMYMASYVLVRQPVGLMVNAAQSVIYPFVARMADKDQADLRTAQMLLLFMVATLLAPLFVFVGATSQFIVISVYGKEWLEAADILSLLAIAMPFHAVTALTGPVLLGIGCVRTEFRIQLITLASSVLLISVGWSQKWLLDASDVASITLAIYVLRAALMTAGLSRKLKTPFVGVMAALLPGILLSTALYWLVSALKSFPVDSTSMIFCIQLGAFLGAYVLSLVVVFCLRRSIGLDGTLSSVPLVGKLGVFRRSIGS